MARRFNERDVLPGILRGWEEDRPCGGQGRIYFDRGPGSIGINGDEYIGFMPISPKGEHRVCYAPGLVPSTRCWWFEHEDHAVQAREKGDLEESPRDDPDE